MLTSALECSPHFQRYKITAFHNNMQIKYYVLQHIKSMLYNIFFEGCWARPAGRVLARIAGGSAA